MHGRLACLVVMGIATRTALAQSPAEDAFQRGRAALQQGNYEQACAGFEESFRLAPLPETRFNIALCSEQLGKLATALRHHEELARSETGPRKARSVEAAAQLGKRVPRLRVELASHGKAMPPGLVVALDGARVTNFKDTPLDLGSHVVMAAAAGHENWRGEITAKKEREVVTVSITLVPGEPGPDIIVAPPPDQAPVETPDPTLGPEIPAEPTNTRRRIGIAMTIAGGTIAAIGLGAGWLAKSAYDDAKAVCGGATACSDPAEHARANDLVDSARLRGNISTIAVVAGAAVGVTGLVLWVTAPSSERALGITPTSNGVALSGRF